MTDDKITALIARLRAWLAVYEANNGAERTGASYESAPLLLSDLQVAADALEASRQAPAPSVQEALDLLDSFHGDNRMGYDAYTNLHDAIASLSVQAPAVSREALAQQITARVGRDFTRYPDVHDYESADRLFASGVLQDAADIWRKAFYAGERRMMEHQSFASPEQVEAARAQQVREGTLPSNPETQNSGEGK